MSRSTIPRQSPLVRLRIDAFRAYLRQGMLYLNRDGWAQLLRRGFTRQNAEEAIAALLDAGEISVSTTELGTLAVKLTQQAKANEAES